MNIRRDAIILSLAALVPLGMFVLFGYNGSDIRFHYASWMGYADAIRQGDLLPGWDGGANHGLGSPRFYFYPPLAHLLGGLIGAVLPVSLIGIVFAWGCLLLSGCSMHVLSRIFVPPRQRLLAALLYMGSYYVLYMIFTRFAAGSMLLNGLMPLTLYCFIRLMRERAPGALAGLAGLLAAGWATDVPVSIACAYLLGVTAVVTALRQRAPGALVWYCLAQLIAILLVSWYLVPAFLASGYIASTDYLYYGYTPLLLFSLEWLSNISADDLIHLLLFGCTAGGLIVCGYFVVRERRRIAESVAWQIMITTGAIFFLLQLPGTRFIWEWVPMFRIIGFNARFHVFLAVLLCLMATVLAQGRWRYPVYGCWALLFLVIVAGAGVLGYKAEARGEHYLVHRTAGLAELHDDHPGVLEYLSPAVVARFDDGTDFTPIYAGVSRQARELTQRATAVPADCRVAINSWEAARKQLVVDAPDACTVTLRHFYFPYWTLQVDGRAAEPGRNPAGLMTFRVDAGHHEVTLAFRTPARNLWIGLSGIVAGLLLLGVSLRALRSHRATRAHHAAP
ncbi:hypothetical protein C7446_2003 [Kushneria sinocarnis]|uniref:Membrane protein YfhO n=1 Tax=Kushneria sinocarnis TaxID=595502 RepID=A0A420WWH2_9GAMM|nr:hypothetical protein [Kushneria sinocarnis]RKR03478.1 hypothetical protein C7446_2003 [Kushneria sinocarnis]